MHFERSAHRADSRAAAFDRADQRSPGPGLAASCAHEPDGRQPVGRSRGGRRTERWPCISASSGWRSTRSIAAATPSCSPVPRSARASRPSARKHAPLPVLKPNEAMITDAAAMGLRVGLVATFPPTLDSMRPEFPAHVDLECALAEGALAALNAGDTQRHDALDLPGCTGAGSSRLRGDRARAVQHGALPIASGCANRIAGPDHRRQRSGRTQAAPGRGLVGAQDLASSSTDALQRSPQPRCASSSSRRPRLVGRPCSIDSAGSGA